MLAACSPCSPKPDSNGCAGQRPTHLRGVANYAIDRLDDAQVAALAEICARMLDGGNVVPAARNGADAGVRHPG